MSRPSTSSFRGAKGRGCPAQGRARRPSRRTKFNDQPKEAPMAYETIKYEVAEQILTITLNR
ncbi:MAG: hypothetical protein ACJ8E2_17100, partial [Bradyrhizobium sp.]